VVTTPKANPLATTATPQGNPHPAKVVLALGILFDAWLIGDCAKEESSLTIGFPMLAFLSTWPAWSAILGGAFRYEKSQFWVQFMKLFLFIAIVSWMTASSIDRKFPRGYTIQVFCSAFAYQSFLAAAGCGVSAAITAIRSRR
jgi:hypothetical protein